MLITGIITLEENARPHVAHIVIKMLFSQALEGARSHKGWKVPEHLPNNPDI